MKSLIVPAICIVALWLTSCTLTVTPEDAIRAFEVIQQNRSSK